MEKKIEVFVAAIKGLGRVFDWVLTRGLLMAIFAVGMDVNARLSSVGWTIDHIDRKIETFDRKVDRLEEKLTKPDEYSSLGRVLTAIESLDRKTKKVD